MSKGASYDDQALLSIIIYPYLFKLFLAPFIDLLFFKTLGKCKTYIVIPSYILAVILFIIAPNSERWIIERKVSLLTAIWFGITMLIVFFVSLPLKLPLILTANQQISCETWILTLLSQEQKKQAGLIIALGLTIGYSLTVNIFMPLNSVKWLNKHFYTKNPRTEPLITHKGVLQLLAMVMIVFGLYIHLTVPEKISSENAPTFKQLVKMFPKFFKNKWIRLFLIYLFITKMMPAMVDEGIFLKFIQNGMDKTSLINLSTILMPLSMVLTSCSGWLVSKMGNKKLLKGYHIFQSWFFVLSILNFIVLKNLIRKLQSAGYDVSLNSKINRKICKLK